MSYILVVDDEPDICALLKGIFEDDGSVVQLAINSDEALDAISKKEPDLIILDIWLRNSDLDGIEILKKITKSKRDIPVVIISGHGNIEVAVEAIKLGAYDFIEKPFNTARIQLVKNRALESRNLRSALLSLKNQNKKDYLLLGNSQGMKGLKKELIQLSNRNSRIFITGETGSGKETAMGYMHSISQEHTGEFHVVVCSSITDTNFEEIFFGTDVSKDSQAGVFDRAENGSIYLKEITDLPKIAQDKLLAVLSSNTFKRPGDKINTPLKTRLISGSRYDSVSILQKNMIRADLFHRLNVIEVSVPPLSSRKEDIAELSNHFLVDFNKDQNLPLRSMSLSAINELKTFNWIGNVRQLKNLIEKILILGSSDGVINKNEISQNNHKVANLDTGFDIGVEDILGLNLKEARNAFELYYLSRQIQNFNGNITNTAKFIGMERSALHRKLKDLKS